MKGNKNYVPNAQLRYALVNNQAFRLMYMYHALGF